MNKALDTAGTKSIVVDEVFPHTREVVWKTLTTPELMGRWLMMPAGFEPVKGKRFTFKTTPAGAWDGTIRLEVLEVVPNERLVYSWQGGDAGNEGYGSPLKTVVTWTLTQSEGGTRLHLEHAGFGPQNESAFKTMGGGWPKVVQRIGAIAAEQHNINQEKING